MAKYRVLHIVPALYSGGVGSFLLNYYRRFDRNEFVFDFVTHYDEKVQVLADPIMANSKVYYVQQQHNVGTLDYVKQFKSIIKEGNYDIVHIHNGHLTGFLSMICKWYGAKRTVCHAHTTRCMNPSLNKLMPVFRWMSRRFSDLLMACGYDAGHFCYGTDHFKVIPNGIDFSRYQRRSEKEIRQLKHLYNIKEDAFIVGCVAQFTPPKNHKYLIKIFNAIHERNVNSILMLVGEGELREGIEQQVRDLGLTDNVVFTGLQNDIPLFLSIFDVFLLPSIHEGLPVVAAEAQAMGLKCVFSKNIDNTCDRNVGLMTFLPISDDDIYDWAESAQKPYIRPTSESIRAQFKKDYYDIEEGTKLFQEEYRKLMNVSK